VSCVALNNISLLGLPRGCLHLQVGMLYELNTESDNTNTVPVFKIEIKKRPDKQM